MPAYQKIIWIGLGVTVIAILALGYFLFLTPEPAAQKTIVPELSSLAKAHEETAPPEEEAPDPDIVPLELELDQSDGAVRELVATAEVPSALREWIRQKDLIRTAVAAVDNIAQGLSPERLALSLAAGFHVDESTLLADVQRLVIGIKPHAGDFYGVGAAANFTGKFTQCHHSFSFYEIKVFIRYPINLFVTDLIRSWKALSRLPLALRSSLCRHDDSPLRLAINRGRFILWRSG